MVMLENQCQYRGYRGERKNKNNGSVEANAALSFVTVPLLPQATGEARSSTGIGRDEVTRSNGSSTVRRLGKVSAAIASSGHGGMPSWRGGSPRRDTARIEHQGQTPLRVDSFDRTPLNDVTPRNISNIKNSVGEDEARLPEGGPRCGSDENGQGKATPRLTAESISRQVGDLGEHNNSNNYGREDATGLGNEKRHDHHGVTEGAR